MALSIRDAHFQMRRRRRISGQGVTEYILLLVVVIMLVMGITFQFNDAFRVWANNYFGDYVSCLLETGELPAIGGTGGVASACDQIFQPFSIGNGRPHLPSGSGGPSSSPSPSPSQNPPKENSVSAGRSAQEGNSRSGPNRVGGNSGSGGPKLSAPSKDGGSDAGAQGRKAIYTGSTEAGVPGGVSGIGGANKGNKRGDLDTDFRIRQNKENEGRPPLQVIKTSNGKDNARKGRILITRKLAKESAGEADRPMSFGDYLRYILIIALILALILVVGSQIMQVSKEME